MSKSLYLAIALVLALGAVLGVQRWLARGAQESSHVEVPTPSPRGGGVAQPPERAPQPAGAKASAAERLSARDPGSTRQASTGAIQGRVADEAGRPLAGAVLELDPSPASAEGRPSRTAADGTYRIDGVPAGTYGVRARADGFLSLRLEPVAVELGQVSAGVDFALPLAPTIEGRVVDGEGRPLAGVTLRGRTATAGGGAGALSGADGRFVIFLAGGEPQTLVAELAGHEPWGTEHGEPRFGPGTRGLEIALEPLPRTRFVVVDALDDSPIERFALRILAGSGSRSPNRVIRLPELGPLEEEWHAGGSVELGARPGIDGFVVHAEGYLTARGDVAHDSPRAALQTLRLRRASGLRGRVLREGAPVAGAAVEAVRVTQGRLFSGAQGTGDRRYSIHTEGARSTQTDELGRFELGELLSGEHRLRVLPSEGAPLVLMPLAVAPGEVRALGDLHLLPGAAIEGAVLLPADADPEGLEVRCGAPSDGIRTRTDGAGRFSFEDLAPGQHVLYLGARPGVVAAGKSQEVELLPGETRAVTIDAREGAR